MKSLLAGLLVCGCALAASFVTSVNAASGATRNDFTGFVGMEFTVGAANVSVTSLGRYCASGNAQTHTVYLTDASSIVLVASVAVNMTGCTPGTFVYGSISTATLTATHSYYLTSKETSGGDLWWDDAGLSITTSSVATVLGSVYTGSGPPPDTFLIHTSGVISYVPLSFQYAAAGGSQTFIF